MEQRSFLSKIKAYVRSLPTAALIIDAVGVSALALLLALRQRPEQSPLGFSAALLSVVLFTALGLRFSPRWVAAWSLPGTPALPEKRVERRALWRVFGLFVLADAFTLVLVYALLCLRNGPQSFTGSISFWRCLDSNSYLEIAQYGYAAHGDRAVQLVFLPGYPLMVRLFHLLIGGDYVWAGLLEAGLCFAGAGTVLYVLTAMDHGRRTARRCVRLLCLFPGAFFFAAPMSESQFLLLTLLCVLCARRKKWGLACIFGGLAAFTRTIGLVAMALVLFELISDAVQNPRPESLRRRIGRFAAVLLIPAGFGAYLLINRLVTGDPLRFLVYQREHWSQGAGFFFDTAAYQSLYARGAALEGDRASLVGLWLPQLIAGFAALPVLTAAVKKLRPSYSAYAIGYYAMAMGCTWLLSAVRYLDALFVLPMALAVLTQKRRTDAAVSVFLALAAAGYVWLFVIRWQIW